MVSAHEEESLPVKLLWLELLSFITFEVVKTNFNILLIRLNIVLEGSSLPLIHLGLIVSLLIFIPQVLLKVFFDVLLVLDFFLLFHSP